MNKRILIVYASETGSTVDVASEIGNTLAGDGWMVDVQAVQKKTAVSRIPSRIDRQRRPIWKMAA